MTDTPTVDDLQADGVLAVGTVKAAEMLGISRRYLMTLIYAEEIKASKLPSSSGRANEYRIKVSELRDFLDRHEQTTP